VVRRLTGIGLVAIGAVGLTVSVLDEIALRECLTEGLLSLCGGIPEFLFGLWFILGVVGGFLVARRRSS
jgi:ABC-type thiamin/hydroxymethylpyrimidine transport system permease subunit